MSTPAIIIIRAARRDGTDVAMTVHAGRLLEAASRHGATMAPARMLGAAGVPDQPVEARGQDGRRRFTCTSLHRLAELTVAENEHHGPRIVRWRANTRFPPLPEPPDGADAPAGDAVAPHHAEPLPSLT